MSVFYNMPPESPPENFVGFIEPVSNIGSQLAELVAGASLVSQQDSLFNMMRHKDRRNRNLRENISEKFSGKIYMTDNIFHAVQYLPPGAEIEFFNLKTCPNAIHNSIIILSNNMQDCMTDGNLNKYIELYLNSPSSVFVIWDFDNHHWISLSSILATLCDLYVPAHNDNLDVLSRFNNNMAGPIGAGTIQWTKEFLKENSNLINETNRQNAPLGTHIEYPQFPRRQKVLQILNKTLSNVKLVDGSYHGRSMIERFTEWCSHKSHWVVPVQNDVPIRVFDALITGGIPIIPRSLKYHKDIINLWGDILFYDYEDIHNPIAITEKANNLFDERGIQGVLDRHYKVLYNYHVDSRIESILKAVYDEYGIPGLV